MGAHIFQHANRSGGAQDYRAAAEEILADEQNLSIDDFEAVAKVKGPEPAPGTDEWIMAQAGPRIVGESVLFSLVAPHAREVELVGSFNHWSREESVKLTRRRNGLWIAYLRLEPGRHLYKFVIDGAWLPDPANENREEPNKDCVVEVPAPESAVQPERTPPALLKSMEEDA